jgi:hypothetical protein
VSVSSLTSSFEFLDFGVLKIVYLKNQSGCALSNADP